MILPVPTPCQAPPTPSISASAGPLHRQITVTVSVPNGGYTTILYSSDGVNFQYGIQLSNPNSLSYTFSNFDTNKTYYFKASSWNGCEVSGNSTAQATTFDIAPPILSLDNSVHQRIGITSNVPTGADGTTIVRSSLPFDATCNNGETHILTFYSSTYPMPIINNVDTNKVYYYCAIAGAGTRSRYTTASITSKDIDPPTLSLDNSVHRQIKITSNVPTGADSTDLFRSEIPLDATCSNSTVYVRRVMADTVMPIINNADTNKLYYYCAIAYSGTRKKYTQMSVVSKDIEAPVLSGQIINSQTVGLTTSFPLGADAVDILGSLVPLNATCTNATNHIGRVTPLTQLPLFTGITTNSTFYYCAIAYSGTRQKASNIVEIPVYNDVNAGDSCPIQSVGKPINVTNGNMWLQQSDYSLSGGVGESINVSRTYNSITQSNGMFGTNWSTELNESISVKDNFVVAWMLPNGRGVYFRRTSTTTPFSPIIPGTFENLIKNGDNTYTVNFKDGRTHRFGANGKILYKQDRNANQTTYNYGTNGNLENITDAFGRTIYFTVINSLVTQISDAVGIVAIYEYFPSTSNLKSVTYADSSKYQFEYAVFGGKTVLTTVKDALNNILETHQYDSNARATTSEVHGGVEKYTLDYSQINAAVPYTTVTDALGRVTKYYFDKSKLRNVITQVEGNCNCGGSSQTTAYEYDANLNKTKKTDGNGVITRMTYDTSGNMLTETDPTGIKTYTYNSFGQVLTAKDQMNGITTVVYDANGRPTQIKDALNNSTNSTYNAKGQILTVTDARGKVTTYTWTNANLIKIKDANLKETNFVYDSRSRLTSTANALSFTTSYQYDLVNRLKKITYPDTKFESFGYDLAGRRTTATDSRGFVTTFGYDSAYRLTSVTDALNHTTSFGYDLMSNRTSTTDAEGKVTNVEYDAFDRVKKVIYPEITVGGIRLNEQFQYDNVGGIKKKIDTAGRETFFDYDNANRLIKTTDALNQITMFEYNARSQTTKVRDALNQETVFTFDSLGRQLSETRDGTTMSYEFDAVGNRTKRTDYVGRATTYEFDNLNRLKKINYLLNAQPVLVGNTVTYNYDDLSRLVSAINENGTVAFTYNNRNRMTSTTDVFGHVLGNTFDANGNRTALTIDGVSHTGYQFDSVNRLTQLTDETSQNYIFSYDVTNKLKTKTLPNNVVTSYDYDGMERLTRLKHQGTSTVTDNSYAYNPANQISNIAGLSQTKTFGYDNVDRLTNVTGSVSESYIFDAVGNRTSSSQSASYTYQANNRLTSTATGAYTYNANGTMASKFENGKGFWRYNWDHENRLYEASTRKQRNRYRYDALGRRISRYIVGGKENTKFTYDGNDVVLDDNSGVITKYQNGLGIDNKLKMVTNGVSKYFLQDHLGSSVGSVNAIILYHFINRKNSGHRS